MYALTSPNQQKKRKTKRKKKLSVGTSRTAKKAFKAWDRIE